MYSVRDSYPCSSAAGRTPIACLPITTPSADPSTPPTSPMRPASNRRSSTICSLSAPMARSIDIAGRRCVIAMLIALKIRNPATTSAVDAVDNMSVRIIATGPVDCANRKVGSATTARAPTTSARSCLTCPRSVSGAVITDEYRIDHAYPIGEALYQ